MLLPGANFKLSIIFHCSVSPSTFDVIMGKLKILHLCMLFLELIEEGVLDIFIFKSALSLILAYCFIG